MEDGRVSGGCLAENPEVSALRRSLGLPDPGVPPVPGPDEGQGRAAGQLHPLELLLRPHLRIIVPPVSLDSSLAIHPGSKREEAVDVSEYGRAGRRGLGEAGRPPQAVERAAQGRDGVATAAGGGHRRGEPGDSGCAAGAGAVAVGVPGRRPAGSQEGEPAGRRADADPGEAGRDSEARMRLGSRRRRMDGAGSLRPSTTAPRRVAGWHVGQPVRKG